jgi:hypothetical protein
MRNRLSASLAATRWASRCTLAESAVVQSQPCTARRAARRTTKCATATSVSCWPRTVIWPAWCVDSALDLPSRMWQRATQWASTRNEQSWCTGVCVCVCVVCVSLSVGTLGLIAPQHNSPPTSQALLDDAPAGGSKELVRTTRHLRRLCLQSRTLWVIGDFSIRPTPSCAPVRGSVSALKQP